ncbi:crotonase/enoyl-CoA hydratase family protein [Nocardia aobensis]|uniref:Crotonase/enoyl-CoA hydratase family protein n=1 Tax=Nocardia aobensis TaxID=257277 RepID=A0ABW6PFD5_9NOCA
MTNPEPPALVDVDAGVCVITINRPDAMNAVNSDVSTAVGSALRDFAADDALRVAIITGAGRAFCAGADLKAVAAGRSFLSDAHPEWGFGGVVQQFVDKPIIAAVNGFALGGGTEIVLACDLAVISNDASLGLPEVTRGLVAGAGGLLRLPDQIPQKVAAEAIFTGQPLSADTALRWGLVNAVVEPAEVLPEAMRLARRIAANAPLAISTSKSLMSRRRDHGSDWSAEAWSTNDTALAQIMNSADAREGTTAFAEKREPRWTGK